MLFSLRVSQSVYSSGFNTGTFWSFALVCLTIACFLLLEFLLGPYIILNGFLAWRRIHFGRVLTLAFIPSLLLDEGHSLYLQNDFPLYSFIPAFLPSSTPGHESENLTPRTKEEENCSGRQTERERQGDGDSWGEKEELIDISEKQVTWEDTGWPCFVDIQNTAWKAGIKFISAQMVQVPLHRFSAH